jgi:hypothetical protein
MSFFQRFFAALDGPAPVSSLDLVADEMRYAIFWTQSAGVRTWTHHLTRTAVVDGVEMVVGETRDNESGERAATFVAAAELDQDGRMTRYMVARTPAIGFVEG